MLYYLHNAAVTNNHMIKWTGMYMYYSLVFAEYTPMYMVWVTFITSGYVTAIDLIFSTSYALEVQVCSYLHHEYKF